MKTILKRRKQGKTDYKARINLLKSNLPRLVVRRSNRYIIGQHVKSEEARDKVIDGVSSKSLLKYGWNKEKSGSLKSKPAAYLTGFLLGKKILDKEENAKVIIDIGLRRSIAKSRNYAFVKGIKDAGIKINIKEEMLPKVEIEEKIKKAIEASFL